MLRIRLHRCWRQHRLQQQERNISCIYLRSIPRWTDSPEFKYKTGTAVDCRPSLQHSTGTTTVVTPARPSTASVSRLLTLLRLRLNLIQDLEVVGKLQLPRKETARWKLSTKNWSPSAHKSKAEMLLRQQTRRPILGTSRLGWFTESMLKRIRVRVDPVIWISILIQAARLRAAQEASLRQSQITTITHQHSLASMQATRP